MVLRVLSRSLLRRADPQPLRAFSRLFSTSPRRGGRRAASDAGGLPDGDESEDSPIPGLFVLSNGDLSLPPPRLLVVQPRLRPEPALQQKLAEAISLADSLEEPRGDCLVGVKEGKGRPPTPHLVVQNPAARVRRAVRADKYFGPGTVDNVKCYLRDLESKEKIDAVYVNAILSGIQQRNLEVIWGKPVLDRVGLIIEIFNAHAETKEAKLQSELAALMYKKTRLVRVRGPGGRLAFGPSGEAEVVSARGRGGSGGRGFVSGAGETELQLQRRRIQERRNKLLFQIEEVRRTRALQRSSRKKHGLHGGLATVAIVGYTNAGKSTLVSALTESDLYSDDRLFATVDPRLRSVVLPHSGAKVLLSDTVGFISDLPVQLVEAFHATLEEVIEADLLVHVLDASAPNIEEHRSTVLQVLDQIGVAKEKIQNMIEVWNKIDIVESSSEADELEGPNQCALDVLDEVDKKQDMDKDYECLSGVNATHLPKNGEEDGKISSEVDGKVAGSVSSTVLQVLHQIGLPKEKIQNMIGVWDKIDTVNGNNRADELEDRKKYALDAVGEVESNYSDMKHIMHKDHELSCRVDTSPLPENEEVDGIISEEDDETLASVSSIESSDEDANDSGHISDGIDDDSNGDVVADELSFGEPVSENPSYNTLRNQTADVSPSCHVRISATKGVGLQQLLILIDEKLNKQRIAAEKSFGPFDRKWRSSYPPQDDAGKS